MSGQSRQGWFQDFASDFSDFIVISKLCVRDFICVRPLAADKFEAWCYTLHVVNYTLGLKCWSFACIFCSTPEVGSAMWSISVVMWCFRSAPAKHEAYHRIVETMHFIYAYVYRAVIMRRIQQQNSFHQKTNRSTHFTIFMSLQHVMPTTFQRSFYILVHSPRMLQNKLKGEHCLSFTELCKPRT